MVCQFESIQGFYRKKSMTNIILIALSNNAINTQGRLIFFLLY